MTRKEKMEKAKAALVRAERAKKKLLRAAIERNAKSPAAHHNYAILLVREGDGETALAVLNRALTFRLKVITEKNIRLTVASCYWVMEDIDKAIETLEDMRVRYEYVNVHVLTSLGYMYFLRGETDKALEFTNLALEDAPDNGAAWDNLGQIYFSLNEAEKAKEAFETAVSHKPDLPDSNYYLGLIAENEDDGEKALEYFSKAMECGLSALNTVTKEQIEEKYMKFLDRISE